MTQRSSTGQATFPATAVAVLVAGLWALWASAADATVVRGGRTIADFADPGQWQIVTSNQVTARLRKAEGPEGKPALCLDYDYNGVSGYAGIRRRVPLQYPDNYQFNFQLRGDSPGNDLQFKLVDASGDNVWWVNRPRYPFPKQWIDVRYKKRQIDKAWGPDPDKTLRRSEQVEFTIYNSVGGKGSVCLAELRLTRLPAQDDSPLTGTARASNAGSAPRYGQNGKALEPWRAQFSERASLTLDLGTVRELGGITLEWDSTAAASDYRLEASDDGQRWRLLRDVTGGNGGVDHIALPETEARWLRITPTRGPGGGFELTGLYVRPLSFAATRNEFIAAIAKDQPRGRWPRGFSGEQPYWTLLGLDGGTEQGLLGEDGALEVARGGFSIEPFVIAGNRLLSWADVTTSQSLLDGYLPMPQVHWAHDDFSLDITAFAEGEVKRSRLLGRYTLTNTSKQPRSYVLALAVRPLQVNPPRQFLSTQGGYSPIRQLAVNERKVGVDGKTRVYARQAADAVLASSFAGGDISERLAAQDWKAFAAGKSAAAKTAHAEDRADAMASGALLYRRTLQPGQSIDVDLDVPMTGDADFTPATLSAQSADALQAQVAAMWHRKLDAVTIEVPEQGRHLVNTLRTNLAHMLISRIGPRLQPGTRSYARSWIRDGAMISEGLLRMGRGEVAREYIQWYAPYQFKDGMVPCCVDDRGSDPVPENDSHGELLFNIAEVFRYGAGDKAFLRTMWPHVQGAVGYMDTLRLSERTAQNRARDPGFYGMMPVSISHEGYSAKPVHSYWDNFWALRGYKDAVAIAGWLGEGAAQAKFTASRDQFSDDLYASIPAAAKARGIDFIPGSVELGDFDPTSTTIALTPGGEQGRLPQPLLDNTFDRYWSEFVARRDGRREWKDYTPYELRNVGAFVRLGQRERAHEALEFFFADQQPRAWNQWAEVVSRTPRVPFFVGDLPHAWVESDYVRAVLDMFAYTRDIDDALVIGAGLPPQWLEQGVGIDGLRTPYGQLAYRTRRAGQDLVVSIDAGIRQPAGGVVLAWPYTDRKSSAASVNGKLMQWKDGELKIDALPVTVRTRIPN